MQLGRDQIEALETWARVTVTMVRSDAPDLTQRQLAVLMSVRLGEAPHTVRGLAADLNIAKPAVSRALDRLSILGLVRRKTDPDDRRNVLVQRTVKGATFLSDFAAVVTAAGRSLDGG